MLIYDNTYVKYMNMEQNNCQKIILSTFDFHYCKTPRLIFALFQENSEKQHEQDKSVVNTNNEDQPEVDNYTLQNDQLPG